MPEFLYPGVHLTEVAFAARPIDGVATSTDGPPAAVADDRALSLPTHRPEWTDHNTHDPGVTLVELLDYALLPLDFGIAAALDERVRPPAAGIAGGFAVAPRDGDAPRVAVSAGLAVATDGTPFEPAASHRLRWPPLPPA